MVDEQPDVELGPGQLSGRQRPDALGQRGASDRDRVDAVGLAALAARAPGVGHQPRRHPNHPLAARDQKPLERARTRAGSPPAPTPDQGRDRAPTAARHRTRERRPRRSSHRASRPSPPRRRRACASSCACPHRARSSACVPFSSRLKWTAGGHGLLGARPRSFQVTPDIPDRRRATQQKEVRPTRPTASKRVSSPPVGTIPSASDVTDDPNHNSKPRTSGAARSGQPSADVATPDYDCRQPRGPPPSSDFCSERRDQMRGLS